MPIREALARQGQFLFRWRSFVPLVLLLPGALALSNSAHVIEKYGDSVAHMWVFIGALISIFGLAIRWVTVGFVPAGTSGRNTTEQRAFELNTSGMYSICRNPLYLGNFFAILGVVLSIKVWWLVAIFVLAYWLYIERVIAAEEAFLTESFGEPYLDWARQTPVFWPDFKKWKKPALPFSFKTVLRREYNGLFGVGAAFFLTEWFVDVIMEGQAVTDWLKEDHWWAIGFVFTGFVFLVLRTLKKHTKVLKVSGR